MTPEQEERFKSALPLARYLAKRFANLNGRKDAADDMYQEACIALVKAVENWRPNRAASFKTFARAGMWMYMVAAAPRHWGTLNVSRRSFLARNKSAEVSLDEHGDGEAQPDWVREVQADNQAGLGAEARAEANGLADKLERHLRSVDAQRTRRSRLSSYETYMAVAVHGHMCTEVAQAAGVSKAAANKKYQETLKRVEEWARHIRDEAA